MWTSADRISRFCFCWTVEIITKNILNYILLFFCKAMIEFGRPNSLFNPCSSFHNIYQWSSPSYRENFSSSLCWWYQLIDKSLKKINKYINRDVKCAVDWIRGNKLSLNMNKTEIVLFQTRNKDITKHPNFRISGKK